MDRISLLPNDLLLQILSLLPTKDVLTTSVLSKRWRYLWQLVPKLEYIDIDESSDHVRFLLFVNMSLLLNTAPVLESLNYKLGRQCNEVDHIGFWLKIAMERGLRALNFDYSSFIDEPCRLPQSLYTCGTLVVLKLQNVSLVDVQFPVCFQLLKTLHLLRVKFLDNNESPQNLFSSCPVLEVLLVDRMFRYHVNTFSVKVPSLQRLIYNGTGVYHTKLVINTPSLKYLKTSGYCDECMIEYMPEIVEASVDVDVTCSNPNDILRSLTSVKRLFLCLSAESPFPTGRFFHQLVHLEFCTCATGWDHLLMSVLQHSPKLRSLKLNQIHCGVSTDHWDEPSSVPETLMFALETFEWRNYKGGKTERQLATFILKHSRRLKIATTFSPQPQVDTCTKLRVKYRMLMEYLARLLRGSTECELVFG